MSGVTNQSPATYTETYIPVWDEACRLGRYLGTFFRQVVKTPPRAPGHGILGSFPELQRWKYQFLPFVESYHKEYAKEGISALHLGPRTYYIVSNPAIARAVFKRSTDFIRGETLKVWRKFSEHGLQETAQAMEGRRAVTKAVGIKKVPDYFSPISRTAKNWTDRASSFKEPFDLMRYTERGTLAALGCTFFKKDPGDVNEKNPFSPDAANDERCIAFLDAYHSLFCALADRLTSPVIQIPLVGDPLYSYLNPDRDAAIEEAKTTLKEILDPLFRNLLADPSNIDPQSHRGHLLAAFKIDPHNPDYDAILDDSLGFLQAAFETSSKSLGWMLFALAEHPEIQEELRKQLRERFGETPPTSLQELKEVPLLFQCLEETLRLYPPLPFLVRDIQEDSVVEGFQVYKAGTFVLSPFLVHRNAEEWEDPQEWRPSRFDEEKRSDGWQTRNQKYLSFISGIHRCPGRHFAKQELALLAATFLLKHEIKLSGEVPNPMQFKFGITLQPRETLHATVE